MYDTDGDFGKVRLAACSEATEYADCLGHIPVCGWHRCNDKYRYSRVCLRGSSLLFYTVDGMGELRMNGMVYHLSPGSAIILPSNTEASYYTPPGGLWEFYWVHFNGLPCEPLLKLIQKQPEQLVDFRVCGDIRALVEFVLADRDLENPSSMLEISDQLTRILHQFLRLQNFGVAEPPDDYGEITRSALRFLHAHYGEAIGTKKIAASLFISPEHLIRVFEKDTGIPPHIYLIHLRAAKAKELLRRTNLPVNMVARFVGYQSPSQFAKRFRLAEGVTPTEYRNGWKN